MPGSNKEIPINRERSNGPVSPVKKRKRLVPGLDYGVELLANSKFTPPSSPLPSERRSLKLDSDDDSAGRSFDINNLLSSHDRKRSRSRHDERSERSERSRRSKEMSHRSERSHRGDERSHRGDERSHRGDERDERSHRGDDRSHRDDERSHRRDDERSRRRDDDRSHRRDDQRRHEDDRRRRDEPSENSLLRDIYPHDDERSQRRSRSRSRLGGMPMLSPSDYEVSEKGDTDRRMDFNLNDILAEDSEDNHRDRDRRRDDDYDRHRYDDSERRYDDHDDHHHLFDEEVEEMRRHRDEAMTAVATEGEEEDLTKLSPKEIMKRKRKALLHIKIMQAQGYEPMKDMGITDPLEEILEVEEEQKERRSLTNGIEFGKKILVGSSYVIETLNKKYDPFDLKLNGWSDQVFQDRDEYNEVLEELYYKYSDQVAMAPEMRLLMMLAGSAFMFHMSNNLMSSGNLEVPNFESIMGSNPELKRAYEQAAMNHMMAQQQNTGGSQQAQNMMGNMMSNILGNMTGDQGMGNMLNDFMNAGGQSAPQQQSDRQVKRSPPAMRASGPGVAPIGRRGRTGNLKEEVEIIPPADPDNILEKDHSGTGEMPRRATRSARDNLKLIV